MIGRVIAGALVGGIVLGAALVLGYRGYQAYLEWLTADLTKPSEQPTSPGRDND
jgi:hypothetical protein